MVETGNLPPSKSKREKCYEARDKYFTCLDENGLWLDGLKPKNHEQVVSIQPSKIDYQQQKPSPCSLLREMFKNECLPSWFIHFQLNRVQDKQSDYLVKEMQRKEQERQSDEYWINVQSK
jgi:cytochrome c oxidase assembly factor 6